MKKFLIVLSLFILSACVKNYELLNLNRENSRTSLSYVNDSEVYTSRGAKSQISLSPIVTQWRGKRNLSFRIAFINKSAQRVNFSIQNIRIETQHRQEIKIISYDEKMNEILEAQQNQIDAYQRSMALSLINTDSYTYLYPTNYGLTPYYAVTRDPDQEELNQNIQKLLLRENLKDVRDETNMKIAELSDYLRLNTVQAGEYLIGRFDFPSKNIEDNEIFIIKIEVNGDRHQFYFQKKIYN